MDIKALELSMTREGLSQTFLFSRLTWMAFLIAHLSPVRSQIVCVPIRNFCL